MKFVELRIWLVLQCSLELCQGILVLRLCQQVDAFPARALFLFLPASDQSTNGATKKDEDAIQIAK